MKKISFLISILFLLSCTSSGNENFDNKNSIEGLWLSECVAKNLSPFPVYSVSTDEYVIMQLNYENDSIIATEYLYSDSLCEILTSEFIIFKGEYTVGNLTDAGAKDPITEINMVGSNPLAFFEMDFNTYYLIEDEMLYMNDTMSSEVSINRDVPFTKM